MAYFKIQIKMIDGVFYDTLCDTLYFKFLLHIIFPFIQIFFNEKRTKRKHS